MRYLKTTFLFFLSFTTPVLAVNDEEAPTDSIVLEEFVVTTTRPEKEIIPVQKLEGKELERLNSHSVADALRYFSGVQVKDYGGVGGIKTVNIRSMGTNER